MKKSEIVAIELLQMMTVILNKAKPFSIIAGIIIAYLSAKEKQKKDFSFLMYVSLTFTALETTSLLLEAVFGLQSNAVYVIAYVGIRTLINVAIFYLMNNAVVAYYGTGISERRRKTIGFLVSLFAVTYGFSILSMNILTMISKDLEPVLANLSSRLVMYIVSILVNVITTLLVICSIDRGSNKATIS